MEDADALTEIAFAAKRHWRYPENWIRQWQEALTITPEYVIENPTFVAASMTRSWVLVQFRSKQARRCWTICGCCRSSWEEAWVARCSSMPKKSREPVARFE